MSNAESIPAPLFSVRGPEGVKQWKGVPDAIELSPLKGSDTNNCRCFQYNAEGSIMAWSDPTGVTVVEVETQVVKYKLDRTDVFDIAFSPQGTFMATWERFMTNKDMPNGFNNLKIWNVSDGTLTSEWVHKTRATWSPMWSDDESICARPVSKEVQFLNGQTFKGGILSRLKIENIGAISISPGKAPYKIAVFVKSDKGAPAAVKIFNYLDLNTAVASKSFFKADRVDMQWNSNGGALLATSHTDVDKTGKSYYGETNLYFLSANGDLDCRIPMSKEGPIFDVQWSPNGKEFAVVHGFMPAKATLFDIKCNPVFDFGTGSRNAVKYSPRGNIICIAGFGNCNGNMEFWDKKKLTLITKVTMSNTTQWGWCPDNEHLLVATTAPRLRIDNCFKLLHYSGKVVKDVKFKEIWEFAWQPRNPTAFPKNPIVQGVVNNEEEKKKVGVYRPPSARGQPSKIKLDREDESSKPQRLAPVSSGYRPSNLPPGVVEEKLSKSQLKNKKKREAAKTRLILEQQKAASSEKVSEGAEKKESAPPALETEEQIEKKLKNLMKKLRQINVLKDRVNSGEKLEDEQLTKLNSETAVNAEIKELQDRLNSF
eukprot:Nk52_evm33s1992 gene=Nk52_evmTU33s1992